MRSVVRSLNDFREQPLEYDRFQRVAGARVLLADYRLIAEDFPGLGDPASVDAWLLDHAAIISATQAAQSLVNDPIPVEGDTRDAARPPWYGRSAVVEVDGGLLDLKGIGVGDGATPQMRQHCDGLLPLDEALHEILFERMCARAFDGTLYGVVPSYGLIDLGFRGHSNSAKGALATVLVRQAHTRPANLWGHEDPGPEVAATILDMLLHLLRCGIDGTLSGYVFERSPAAGLRLFIHDNEDPCPLSEEILARATEIFRIGDEAVDVCVANLQFTTGMRESPRAPRIFDFGAYKLRTRIDRPWYIPFKSEVMSFIGDVLHPDDARLTAVIPSRVPATLNTLDAELAAAYMDGRMTGREVAAVLDAAVEEFAAAMLPR